MSSQRIALVTGAGRGLGREIALALADATAGVAVHYLSRKNSAEETARMVRNKGKLSAALRADLTKESEAAALVRGVERKFGRLDILVNNVGPILMKPWIELTAGDWIRIFRANLLSSFSCLKAALPGMRTRKWGRIINIGYSRAEQLAAFPTITAYAAAKTSLLILTRTAAAAEAGSGVTVNMVSPGLLEGGVLPPGLKADKRTMGTFADVAAAVCYLTSDKAGAVTGTDLIVAGAWKM
ncbi:MAG: SDR family oxidoreductase [Candidatus Aminicenantales bacterium]